MTAARTLLVLVALAVLAGGFSVLVGVGSGEPSIAELPVAVPAPAATREAPAIAELGEVDARPSGDSPALDSEPAPERREVLSEMELALADAHWIDVYVEFPDGTPADEEVVVIGKGADGGFGGEYAASPSPDGTYRVAFAEGTERWRFLLRARYLYLDQDVWFDADSLPSHVVLRPELGGCVRGRLEVAPGFALSSELLVGGKVRMRTSDRMLQTVGPDLTFEFGGLPPIEWHALGASSPRFVTERTGVFRVEPGETRIQNLKLRPGVLVRGRVLEPSHEPIYLAKVGRLERDEPGDRTNEHGAFALEGLEPGFVTVLVSRRGFAPYQVALGELGPGVERDVGDLVLDRGDSITGRLLWPDGEPVERGALTVRPGSGAKHRFRTKRDGAFEIAGLDDDRIVRVEVRAKREFDRGSQRYEVDTVLDGLEPGARDAVVSLPSAAVRGTVIDDVGRPVGGFTLELSGHGAYGGGILRAKLEADSSTGSFSLPGLADGVYDAKLNCRDGHAKIENVVVENGRALKELNFVVPRRGTVSGRVRAPDGKPVKGARPSASWSDDTWTGRGYAVGSPSDDDGQFTIPFVDAGDVRVVVTPPPGKHAWAQIEQDVTLEPGVELIVDLMLRRGATISGTIVDRSGQGAVDHEIVLRGAALEYELDTLSRADGAFTFESLPPGRYEILALGTEADAEEVRRRFGPLPYDALLYYAVATVAEGGKSHVDLVPPEIAPVTVAGVVTIDGRPAGPSVEVGLRLGFGDSDAVACEPNGRFELAVARPGPVGFVVSWEDEDGISHEVHRDVDVPAVGSWNLDFALSEDDVTRSKGRRWNGR